MIAWLDATLPYNPYSIDGFAYGDKYIYPWANNKAEYTETDDDFYFVHRGKLDIFNFSRKPGVNINNTIRDNFKKAYNFRAENIDLITNGSFVNLKTEDKSVFAYELKSENKKEKIYKKIIVIGNLDFKNSKNNVVIKDGKLNKKSNFELIHGDNNITLGKRKLITDLKAGEIKVIKIK